MRMGKKKSHIERDELPYFISVWPPSLNIDSVPSSHQSSITAISCPSIVYLEGALSNTAEPPLPSRASWVLILAVGEIKFSLWLCLIVQRPTNTGVGRQNGSRLMGDVFAEWGNRSQTVRWWVQTSCNLIGE